MKTIVLFFAAICQLSAVSVTTGQYDLARSGANTSETVLTQSNVTSHFGRLWSYSVTGCPSAQPLVVENVTISGSSKTVLIIATDLNHIYAFDALNAGVTFWHNSLGTPFTSPYPANLICTVSGNVGIISTPVVDTVSKVIYFTSCNSSGAWSLHAVNLSDGTDFHAPVTIAATASAATFVSANHLQRPALLLINGLVVVTFGSYGDIQPWYGWIMTFNSTSLALVSAAITTPNSGQSNGAIWMSGGGPSSDGTSIFFITGNGPCDAGDYGDSFVKMSQTLTIQDFMTPTNCATLSMNDTDLGSSRAIIIGNYVMGGGKDGRWWVLNKAALGSNQATGPGIAQVFTGSTKGLFSGTATASANGNVYIAGGLGTKTPIGLFSCPTICNTTPVAQTSGTADGHAMSYSSNGATSGTGILWVTDAQTNVNESNGVGTFHAYNADSLVEIYNDATIGNLAKFTSPTVANGKVYVPTFSGTVFVYGLTDLSSDTLRGNVTLRGLTTVH